MSKRSSSTHFDPVHLPRRLREGLEEANDLLERRHPKEALEILEELAKRHPNQPDVLGMMVNAYHDLKNDRGYLHTMIALHRLTPNRAEVKLGLAGGYLANSRPALAYRTFQEFLRKWPNHEQAAGVTKLLPDLDKVLTEALTDLNLSQTLSPESKLDFASKHEEAQVLMEAGEFERGKRLAEALLKQYPQFTPALNNLSLIEWLEDNLPAAIEASQKVLKQEPENIHALSNLTRFLFMQGKTEQARQMAARLQASGAQGYQSWLKKIEALSFIGDDEGVLALLEEARRADALDELSGLFYHWCAVATYRLGDAAQARAHWQKALKLSPGFELASANLQALKKAPHERLCPQAFSADLWLPKKTIEALASIAKQAAYRKGGQSFQEKMKEFMERHPVIVHFVPIALRNGDAPARETALDLADLSEYPALLNDLKDFAQSQEGTDELRLQALQILSKHGAFQPGQKVDMWIKGKWTPILTLGFEITPEPMLDKIKPKALELMKQAIEALRVKDGARAENLLRAALKIEPEQTSLLNNLALALMQQDKNKEAEALVKHITEDFPEYFFGQITLARMSIRDGNLEKARAIINHWMETKKKFHTTEFSALCKAQIDLSIEERQYDSADSWLEMWERVYPEDSEFKNYRRQIKVRKNLAKFM
ncbi:MAG: hypothetical protein AUJ21_11910 [Anaerolineae bacterium CG1_02_58_13]|nr:MAG: hypothetical protein AUJ21_11910 [Anaerolineae bacterium CG1_02_58_13]